jgi:hypothetical protein
MTDLRDIEQLDKILELDREMMSVDFTFAVVTALLVDMSQDMHRVDMQVELDAIMERVYGGNE